jgi:hypothetical protein
MPRILTKEGLSPARQRLVQVMQDLNFGRIEGLLLRHGEPVFEPPPRLIQTIKLGGDNGPRPELQRADFALKSQVVELFNHFADLADGSIEVLEVQHGLPFKLTFEQPG